MAFCENCGANLRFPDGVVATSCASCGSVVPSMTVSAPSHVAPPVTSNRRAQVLAIAAIVLLLAAQIPLAIICGIAALIQMGKRGNGGQQQTGLAKGLAITGTILGAILIFLAIAAVLFVLSFMRAVSS